MFGVILALVCPIMFGIQNLLLGMCLFEDSRTNGFLHVLQSMRCQLVVLYDISIFRGISKAETKCSWRGVLRILVGYILYVLPICGLITILIHGNASFTLCRVPKSTFLLDNDVLPSVNMATLYEARQSFAQDLIVHDPGSDYIAWSYMDGWGLLLWDYAPQRRYRQPHRRYKYWPLENINDLIKQFNYVGFHDICLYPRNVYDTAETVYSWNFGNKGLNRVINGYTDRNSSGPEYK